MVSGTEHDFDIDWCHCCIIFMDPVRSRVKYLEMAVEQFGQKTARPYQNMMFIKW